MGERSTMRYNGCAGGAGGASLKQPEAHKQPSPAPAETPLFLQRVGDGLLHRYGAAFLPASLKANLAHSRAGAGDLGDSAPARTGRDRPDSYFPRTVDPPLREAEGTRVTGLRRLGKQIVFALEDNLLLVVDLADRRVERPVFRPRSGRGI